MVHDRRAHSCLPVFLLSAVAVLPFFVATRRPETFTRSLFHCNHSKKNSLKIRISTEILLL